MTKVGDLIWVDWSSPSPYKVALFLITSFAFNRSVENYSISPRLGVVSVPVYQWLLNGVVVSQVQSIDMLA